jgi:hypothetical protein
MTAKLVELIEVEEREGRGLDSSDPVRMVTRWYTKAGEMVCERDRWKEGRDVVTDDKPIREVTVDFSLDGSPAFTYRGNFRPGSTYRFAHTHHEVAP